VHHQLAMALTRMAYALTLLLVAASGLALTVTVVGFSVDGTRSPPEWMTTLPVRTLVRAVASFVGACGFAVLFNSSPRNVLRVGVLAIIGNELRLALRDELFPLPLSTFLGAMAVGLTASLAVKRWVDEPRIALTVPGVIMMVPGLYAFQSVVLFNQGEILPAFRAAVLVAFVMGAMAMGLAVARFITQPEWLKE